MVGPRHLLVVAAMTMPLALGAVARGETVCPVVADSARDIALVLKPQGTDAEIPLAIPRAYFDQRFVPASGSTRQATDLRVSYDGFGPWPAEVRPHQSEGPYLSVLIHNVIALSEIADFQTRNTLGFAIADTPVWEDTPADFGLLTLKPAADSPTGTGGLFLDNDVYFARNEEGLVTDVIRCNRPGKTPYQNCVHIVDVGIVDLQLTYAASELPHWRRMSTGARNLFECLKN